MPRQRPGLHARSVGLFPGADEQNEQKVKPSRRAGFTTLRPFFAIFGYFLQFSGIFFACSAVLRLSGVVWGCLMLPTQPLRCVLACTRKIEKT